MKRTIEEIDRVCKELNEVSCGPFLKILRRFMIEEGRKPVDEIDFDFIKHCTDTYVKLCENSKKFK